MTFVFRDSFLIYRARYCPVVRRTRNRALLKVFFLPFASDLQISRGGIQQPSLRNAQLGADLRVESLFITGAMPP